MPASRRETYQGLKPIMTEKCLFADLPEAKSGGWGQGLTAAKMRVCVWTLPKLVAHFEFLECPGANHVRHIKLVRMPDDKDPEVGSSRTDADTRFTLRLYEELRLRHFHFHS
jgi:hypothetical protein